MKRRLCIDIDNCIAATDVVMRRIIHEVTNGRVNLRYQDVREFDYHGPLCRDAQGEGIDLPAWKVVHERFSDPSVVMGIAAIPGGVEAVQSLQEEFEIHFATTRMPKARAATIGWLDERGMVQPYWLHFVGHRQKHSVLANMYAAIDDDAGQAMLFRDSGVRSILLAHPWNEVYSGRIERAPSWRQIVELLEHETAD